MQNKMHQPTHQILTSDTTTSSTTTTTTLANTTANTITNSNSKDNNQNTASEAAEMTSNNVSSADTATPATTTTKSAPAVTTPTSPTMKASTSADQTFSDQPTPKRPKARHSPYSKPILLSNDRSTRKRKSLSWLPEEKIKKVHYFEYIPDERINVNTVNRQNNVGDQQHDANASPMASTSGASSLNANNEMPLVSKITNASVDPLKRSYGKTESTDKFIERLPWPSRLDKIDYTPELPSPGWNSLERSAQAERETYVLGAIDLPGQPSFVDEPDQQPKTDGHNAGEKIVPIDSDEGMFVEYPSMYNIDYVNGIRTSNETSQSTVQNLAPFCNQQSQIFSNQFQQQMVHATQNSFAFPDMGASQFQQQAQMQIQFPFQSHQHPQDPQQPVQGYQQSIMSFANQQQQPANQPQPFADQQSGLSGPVMPWLNYPFNHNENSHAHLFRRPAT